MLPDKDISVILVDKEDNVVGYGEKLDVHRKGLLHRAFSVLIFNEKNELLIQKRSDSKYHSPGLWGNTCCGHPFPNENVRDAAIRRTKEELGFTTDLEPLTHIYYHKPLGNEMFEHEYVHVFKEHYQGQKIHPNPNEVSSYEWKNPIDIRRDMEQSPHKYAAWFVHYIGSYYEKLFSDIGGNIKS